MKLLGNLEVGSSVSLKYLRTCGSCFQKLSVSYHQSSVSICCNISTLNLLHAVIPNVLRLPTPLNACLLFGRELNWGAYLVFHMTLREQHINHRQLGNESMPFELLPYLGPYSRDREIERVHLLDLGSLPNTGHQYQLDRGYYESN